MALSSPNCSTYEELLSSLLKKQFSPVYFFFGKEDFLIDEALESLVTNALGEGEKNFNVDVVYGNDIDADEIVSLASSFPMGAERRVVIVRECDKLANPDSLLSYIEHPAPTTSLVLAAAKPNFRLKFYKVLKEKSHCVEFKELRENEVTQWIRGRIEQLGKKVSLQACQFLQAFVGRSKREIQNEINKLILFVGERKEIVEDDINTVVGMSRQYNIFELQRAVGSRNISRALDVCEHMLEAGEQPVGIVVMMTKYVQRLWMMREFVEQKKSVDEVTAALGFTARQSFFLGEEFRAAQKFSEKELVGCFAALMKADESLKTSDGTPSLIMTVLLYTIVKIDHAD